MEPAQKYDELELEIAAFQGPHIKRARIVLVAVGLIYLVVGYLNYDDVVKLRKMLDQPGTSETLKDLGTFAYAVVIFLLVAGVANIVLAIIAGKKTLPAFYAAMGIFIIHTGLQLYAGGGAIMTNILWWLTAVCLGLGFQAALKANQMRKQARSAPPRATFVRD